MKGTSLTCLNWRLPAIAGLVFMTAAALPALAEISSIKVENPDKRLWRIKSEDALSQDDLTYTCFHSLCPPQTSFNASQTKGPAKRPGKAELQKIATQDLPAALAKNNPPKAPPKITQTTIKGWPALRGTYRISAGEREIGVAFAEIHLDGSIILLRAASSDAAYAPRALDAFLETTTLLAP